MMLSLVPQITKTKNLNLNSNNISSNINMNYTNYIEEKFDENGNKLVLRYCVSELSIPKQARDVCSIERKNNQYNKYTNYFYGFTYWINEKENTEKLRIFEKEKEKIFDTNDDFTLPEYYYSFEKMIEHYNDEVFPNPVRNYIVDVNNYDENYEYVYNLLDYDDDDDIDSYDDEYLDQLLLEFSNNLLENSEKSIYNKDNYKDKEKDKDSDSENEESYYYNNYDDDCEDNENDYD